MWPTFRQNTRNDPSPVTTQNAPDIRSGFKVFLGGIIWGTAVIDNQGNVYVGSTNRRFFCIDATGNIKWIYKLKKKTDSLIDSAAAIHPLGFVVIPGGDGCLHAVDMKSGKLVWLKEMKDVSTETENTGVIVNSFEGNVQIDQTGLIYCGCDNEYAYCISPRGEIIWKLKTNMMIWTCPAVTEQLCVFGSLDFHIYGVNKHTGQLIFKHNLGAEIKSTPLIHNNLIYVATTNGEVFCISQHQIVWRKNIGTNVYSSPVRFRSTIIFACFDGYIVSLDCDTGNEIWRQNLFTDLCCSPIIVNNILYIGNSIGKLIALDSQTGKLVGCFTCTSRNIEKQNINASIVFHNSGHLVFGAYDGFLYFVPWNFYTKYSDTSLANVANITESHPYLRMHNGPGHIITMELVVPGKNNVSISSGSLSITPKIPFDVHTSADGKFINLVPQSWDYLSQTFSIHVRGKYYLQSDNWLKDRFVFAETPFSAHARFSTYIPKSTPIPTQLNLASFYVQQPVVLDTYIPAATDAQGFKMYIVPLGGSKYELTLIPCVPDSEDEFEPIPGGEVIKLQADRNHNIFRGEGSFEFSAMGGTMKTKRFITFFNILPNSKAEGQFVAEANCLSIKGNGSKYKFSSEIVNKVCDIKFNIRLVGEFRGFS